MQWIQTIIFLLTINGLFTLFSVRFNDFLHVLARTQKSTLQDDVDVLLGKPAKGFFNRETLEVEQLLAATGREGRFNLVKRASILLFAVGAAAALLLNNPFLIPILGAGFAFAPVWYLRSTASAYKKHLNEELETAISIVTTSYLRSGDLLKAVKENIPYLKHTLPQGGVPLDAGHLLPPQLPGAHRAVLRLPLRLPESRMPEGA